MQKRAHERGRAVIDSDFLTEIRNESMLRVARCIRGFGFEELSMDAFEVAKTRMRRLPRKVAVIEEIKAFLAERTRKNEMILSKFQRYLAGARRRGEKVVTPEVVEHALDSAPPYPPLSPAGGEDKGEGEAVEGLAMRWSAEAEERLRRIPIAAVRRMVVARVEARCREQGLAVVDLATYELGARG